MLEIVFVRHGQTDWNVSRRVMGTRPIGLNATGVAQVRAVADVLSPMPVTAIYTSPAKRAQESAAILAEGRNGTPVSDHAAFVEVDYGDWIGLYFSQFEALLFNDYLKSPTTFQIPGGESIVGMQRRAVAGVEELRAKFARGRVVIVSHADVIKSMLVHYLDIPLDQWHQFKVDNASLSVLRFEGRPRCLTLNYHPELGRLFGDDLTLPQDGSA